MTPSPNDRYPKGYEQNPAVPSAIPGAAPRAVTGLTVGVRPTCYIEDRYRDDLWRERSV
jgi:hypothetical protein